MIFNMKGMVFNMRILLVDDDVFVTNSLRIILTEDPQIEVCGIGHDGMEAIALYEELRPDILLMDIRMTTLSGLDASKQILSVHPDAKILLLTTFSDDDYIVKALKLGTKGYLLKQDYQSIIPALKAVYSGQTVFGDSIISKVPNLMSRPTTFDYESHQINERELEVIKLVADGLNNKEIAAALFLSEGTVRNYLSTILEKLELRDRTQLAVFYYQN